MSCKVSKLFIIKKRAVGPAEFKHAYEQKRDLGHITLKFVAHDEQKRDSGQITLKIVTPASEQ